MTNSPFFRKSVPILAGLAFAAAWFYLTRGLFVIALRLKPLAAAGEPAAILLMGLALPWAIFLAQGLFYVTRRRSGPPIFIHPVDPPLPFYFLPLPWRTAVESGPVLSLICSAGDREKLLALAEMRCRWSLNARLALLLQGRSPLDRLLSLPVERSWPLISLLARLVSLLLGPARQFLRCWGYLFFRLWQAGEDPGPLDQLTLYKQALAYDLVDRAGVGASDELRRVFCDLARIYDHPDYAYELGEARPGDPDPVGPSPESHVAEKPDPPWLAPRYRGIYLDLQVTRAAASLDELYDGGPEEDPDHFYPPELGREVELTARLTAERRRLARALADGGSEGLVRLDGRLRPTWELENAIWELDDRLWREKNRLAAHHRRCRGSHLAAARRRGQGWPETLRACLARLFLAERAYPEWRDEALAALLETEEKVVLASAVRPSLPWPESAPDLGLAIPPPAPPETPPRVYSTAVQLNVGFGRSLLALIMLGLLFWQGSVAGRSRLIIHNGLDRELALIVDGRRLSLAPFALINMSIPPDHECRIKTSSADGQLIETLEQRTSPTPGREVYSVAGAAPLMEWQAAPAADEGPAARFLGRPRWLRTEALVFFREPSEEERNQGSPVLSGYGADPPSLILAAFEEKDQAELIRLHARWDRPESPWFWHWQILTIGQPDQMAILLDRLQHEPEFLEEGLKRFD